MVVDNHHSCLGCNLLIIGRVLKDNSLSLVILFVFSLLCSSVIFFLLLFGWMNESETGGWMDGGIVWDGCIFFCSVSTTGRRRTKKNKSHNSFLKLKFFFFFFLIFNLFFYNPIHSSIYPSFYYHHPSLLLQPLPNIHHNHFFLATSNWIIIIRIHLFK